MMELINISPTGMECLNEFPKFECDVEESKQVELMIEALNNNYKSTREEICHLFTKAEALLIFNTCFKAIEDTKISSKQIIINSIIHDKQTSMLNFEVRDLIEKIERLSEFQCFTIRMMVKAIEQNTKSSEKIIKNIFSLFKPLETLHYDSLQHNQTQ